METYFGIRERADIPASTIDLLTDEIRKVIYGHDDFMMSVTPDVAKIARAVGARIADANKRYGADSEFAQYHSNLLNSYMLDGINDARIVKEMSTDFESLWKEFGL